MAVKIRLRRDTAENWIAINPVLEQGEMGIETNTRKFKFGDGATAWNMLAYASASGTSRNPAAGIAWSLTETSLNLNSVCYGLGMFVAVGNSGKCMTTPDGFNWMEQAAVSGDWKSVCYGNGLFVAVGSNGKCMTSLDAINWTEKAAISDNWNSVCYGNGLFVAVGNSGKCMTSPDGANWTERAIVSDPESSAIWGSVCWGKGLFVAVGRAYSQMGCAISPDGINWTEAVMPDRTGSVCYGNGLFVAVGGDVCLTSTDGIDWIEQNATGYGDGIICYGAGLFVIMGSSGGMTSPDGENWTGRAFPINSWRFACYGDGLFVAVGLAGCGFSPGIPLTMLPTGASASFVKIQGATTLPAGGTWAYFYFVGTAPTTGIAAGGTSVGAANAVGFAWRIY